MSQDGGGPPAANGGRFPFLKRGTGHKQFERINYIAPIPASTMSQPTASTSSAASNEEALRRPAVVPRLNLHSPTTEALPSSGKDSGRGSTHREPIYAPPSSRRADSGYGEYQQRVLSVSPEVEQTYVNDEQDSTVVQPRENEAPFGTGLRHRVVSVSRDETSNEQTYVNDDQDSTIVQPREKRLSSENMILLAASESASTGEDVAEVLHRTFTNQNASMRSFLRHEQEVGGETQLSTPTRQLGASVEPRVPDTTRSLSSQASDPYDDRPYGPLSSTPIQEVSLDNAPPVPRPRHVTIGETPILRGTLPRTTGSACSTRPPSSASLITPPASFQLRTTSDDDSLRSERRAIAPNDRPLHDAFPQRSLNNYQPRTPPLGLPSQSTQFQQRMEPPRGIQEDLRRDAFRNAARPQQRTALSSSDEMQTPLRKLLPKTNDPVVKDLRRQLRGTIAHMDLAIANLRDKEKSLRQVYDHEFQVLDTEKRRLEEGLVKFHAEKDEWELEQKKTLQRNKRDRSALKEKEEELQMLAAQKEREANGKTVAAQTGAAELRVVLNRKEEEIKKLKENCDKLTSQKARADKLNEQMKVNHAKDLKKKAERISELEKLLAAKENLEPRRRPGIQPRPKPATGGLVRRTSCPDGRALRQSQPEYQEIPEESEEGSEEEQRKHVRWNDEGIQYQFISPNVTVDYFDHNGMMRQQPQQTTMGVVHPFVDRLNRTVYMYQLRHSPNYGGDECGALLYRYFTNDAKWIYGPLEVYLFHKYPLIVKMAALDVEIRITKDQVEVHRPYLEISRYNRLEDVVTDTRRRRDSSGYYAVKNTVRRDEIPLQVIGRSDRQKDEDRSVLRRGTLTDKKEAMEIGNGVNGKYVHWYSKAIRSPEVSHWLVIAEASGQTKMRIYFNNESIDILARAEEDLVIIGHKRNGQHTPCCDIGKPSRDRERSGELVAFGSSLAKHVGCSN